MPPSLALVLLLHVSSPVVGEITLDGGSSHPAEQTVSYSWSCSDGLVTIDVAQMGGSPPSVVRATYGRSNLIKRVSPELNKAIGRFRTVESISPRCLDVGGIWLMFSGLFRDENPSRRHVVSVQMSRRGHLSFN